MLPHGHKYVIDSQRFKILCFNLIGPYVANLLHLKRSSLFGKVRVALGWEVIVAHPPTVDFKSVLSPKTLDQFKPVGFTSLWTVPDAVHFACTPSN